MREKILYIEQTCDGTVGGSHYCLLYLVQHLNRKRYEPIVLFQESNSLLEMFRKECQTEIFGIRRFSRLRSSLLRRLVNVLINFSVVLKCYRFITREEINLIHLNNSVSGGYYNWLVASTLARVPCVTHERNFTTYPKTSFFRMIVKRYGRILPVSNVIGHNIVGQGIDSGLVETVYDGIDPDLFRAKVKKTREDITSEFDIGPTTAVIGLIGNIREWKGQELLVDALNIVNKKTPDFVCLLVGDTGKNSATDSDFAELLRRKIDLYDLEGKVVLTGYRSDVPDLVNALDIQINASIKPDPFPHVILEGMSLGKVLVATNLGGAVESIEDGVSGFLVPPESEALAKKILLLISEKSVRDEMSAHALARIQKFSMARTTTKVEKIYKELLA